MSSNNLLHVSWHWFLSILVQVRLLSQRVLKQHINFVNIFNHLERCGYKMKSGAGPTFLEKALLPYITNNIPQHHTQHGFKAKHSTTTALHNINNTITSGFNQRIPPARTIAVALDMSKAFDTVNIHTLTKKLLDTQIPPILITFIANYIKGRKAFTTYNNKTSTQRQFKTGVPQGGVLSPTLFNIYTSDIPSPPPNINITVYADDITMTSTDTNKQIAQAKLQPYLQEIAS